MEVRVRQHGSGGAGVEGPRPRNNKPGALTPGQEDDMQHSNYQQHIRPTLAAQVLFALEVGKRTREARAQLRRTYGRDGRRVAQIITGEA